MNTKIISFATFLAVFSGTAAAQTSFPVSVGADSASIQVDQNDLILSSFAANQSYCCTLYPDTASALAGFSATLKNSSNANVTGLLRGDVTPLVAVNSSSDSSMADNRVCFLPAATDTYSMTVNSASGGGVSLTVRCDKTSLSGGFNTNGTPFNFLECQNLSESTRQVRLFATDFSGNVLINGNTASNQFTIGAGLRRDFDIHSAVGTNVFGEIRVVTDGPVGSLDCRLSRYESTLEFKGSNSLR